MTRAPQSGPSRLVAVRRWLLGPVHDVMAAVWAARELRSVRRNLDRDGVRTFVRRPPRRTSPRSRQVMLAVTRAGRATCLERSLLRQAWLRERGVHRDILIGVRRTDKFAAHAWLEGDPDGHAFQEIHRITADGAGTLARMPEAAGSVPRLGLETFEQAGHRGV